MATDTTITCGVGRKPCETLEEYTPCDSRVAVGKKSISVHSTADDPKALRFRAPDAPLPEGARNPTEAEVRQMLEEGFIEGQGFSYVCRSSSWSQKDGYRFWAAKDLLGSEAALVRDNNWNRIQHGDNYDKTPFTLSQREALAIVEALELDKYDMPCKENACVKEGPNGFARDGKFIFTKDPERLEYMISKLADKSFTIDGLVDSRRDELLGHLQGVQKKAMVGRELAQQQSEFYDQQSRNSNLMTWTSLLLVFFIGYQPTKDIVAWMRGRVKTTDFGDIIRNRLKADPNYDIKGRNAEAEQAWKMTDTTRYRHLIFDAPTGEGKDVVVEKMIIMKEKGDAAVPKRFRDAKVFKVNAAEFQAGTMYRGNVADKVAEIAKAARKGPVIFYMSEIDLIFLSGGSSSGDSEAVGKLLLDLVEDPAIKDNLILVGTTSRGSKMLEKFPDLQRRFNWPKIHTFTLEEIVDVIDGPTRKSYEKSFEVKIERSVIDAAAKLADLYYRPATAETSNGTQMPRFDAVKTILEDAAKIARDSGATEVTVEHAIQATEARVAQSLDRTAVEKVIGPIFDPAETMEVGAEKMVDGTVKADVAKPEPKPEPNVENKPEPKPAPEAVVAPKDTGMQRGLSEGAQQAAEVEMLRAFFTLSPGEQQKQRGRPGAGSVTVLGRELPKRWVEEYRAKNDMAKQAEGVKGMADHDAKRDGKPEKGVEKPGIDATKGKVK